MCSSRPGHGGANAVGRGVLSMQGLSFGVVRVDQENSLTSLTLQDCGQVLPGAMIVVVKLEGTPHVCRTDEVGEICVAGAAVGSQYWGLKGLTNSIFKVQPLLPDDTFITENAHYVRSGLLGFLGPVSNYLLTQNKICKIKIVFEMMSFTMLYKTQT